MSTGDIFTELSLSEEWAKKINDFLDRMKGTTEESDLLSKPLPIPPGKKPTRNILVIGETGAGKTTFLNLIFNRLKIIEVKKDTQAKWFFGGEHEKKDNKGAIKKKGTSLTDSITEHTDPVDNNIHWFDTPGLGDTRGLDYDLRHLSKIIASLGKMKDINIILLMMNGQANRLPPRTISIFGQLYQYIPKDFLPNIFLVLTRTDHETCNKYIEMMRAHHLLIFPDKNIFVVENPIGDLLEKPCGEYSTKRQRRIQEDMFETRKELGAMFNKLTTKESMDVSKFVELKAKMDSYKGRVENLLEKSKIHAESKEKLAEAQKKSKKTKDQAADSSKYEVWVKIFEKKKVIDNTQQNDTFCTESGCTSICHRDCSVAGFIDNCLVFSNSSSCSQCGHLASKHRHKGVHWKTFEKEQKVIDENLKAEIERIAKNAKNEEERQRGFLDTLTGAIQTSMDGIRASFCAFQELCLPLVYKQYITKKLVSAVEEYKVNQESQKYAKNETLRDYIQIIIAEAYAHKINIAPTIAELEKLMPSKDLAILTALTSSL